jgi:hypothetical protein
VEPPLPVVRRPCLAVALGGTGDTVLAEATAPAEVHPFLPLACWRTAASWRNGVEAVLRHRGTGCRTEGGNKIEILVVSGPDDIAAAWPDLREHLRGVRAEVAAEVVVLEVGRAARAMQGGELEGCLGRFRLGRVYANGRLTEAEEIGLVARLLGLDLGRHLFGFARDRRPRGPVTVGAALGWLPDVPLGLALARCLEEMVAAELMRSDVYAPRRLAPLFRPATLATLAATLRSGLEQEAAVLTSRLDTTDRQAPVREFLTDSHAGEADTLRMVAAWCGQVLSAIIGQQCKASCEIAGFATARAMVEQAVRQLAEAARALRIRERLLAARRERVAREAAARDERRLRARACFFLWRPFVSRRAARQTRRLLQEFGRARVAELLARYEATALEQLRAELEALSRRLEHLLAQAPGRGEDLDALLRPDHPSLLALQDVAALRGWLGVLAESLLPRRGAGLVWERALSGIYRGWGDAAWQAVRTAAEVVAADVCRADEPLARSCRSLLPRFRPATLRHHLARAARPIDAGEPGVAPAEQIVLLQEEQSADGAAIGALCFRWQP